MNNYQNHVGIDTSKETLDVSVVKERKKIFTCQVANDPKGLKALAKKLKQRGIKLLETLFCVEHTGIYTANILHWATENQLSIWVESGSQIQRSLGIKREKSDQVDAYHIAMYASRFEDKCRLWQAPSEDIQKLKTLISLRERLKKSITKIKVPLKESMIFFDKKQLKELEKHSKTALKGLEKSLADTEASIHKIIEENSELKELYDIITSVKGVGFVTAVTLIVFTNAFKNLYEARLIACYAGIAPFEHTSGTSVRGKTKVSHFANKTLKALFHMAAMSAIQNNDKIRAYRDRKVAEGKHKMSVINAVRNKLLLIICACVRKKEKYDENYTYSLA